MLHAFSLAGFSGAIALLRLSIRPVPSTFPVKFDPRMTYTERGPGGNELPSDTVLRA